MEDGGAPYDHLLKILLIGDSSSNKRKLLGKYLRDVDLSETTTLGLDYKLKDVQYRQKALKLQLWDTAGQERFRSVTASYYRGAHGALLVFSLSKDTSFVGLNYWLDEIKTNAPERFQVILIGTDTDSEDSSMNVEIAKQFAWEKQLDFLTCDIRDQVQVDSTFMSLIKKILGSWEDNVQTESIHLDSSEPNSSSGGSCAC